MASISPVFAMLFLSESFVSPVIRADLSRDADFSFLDDDSFVFSLPIFSSYAISPPVFTRFRRQLLPSFFFLRQVLMPSSIFQPFAGGRRDAPFRQ